jgi:arylsulfatase A-like enzyme
MLGLAPLAFSTTVAPPRPNVIVFFADDLGARDLGIEGSTFYETPHLDRFAAEGVRFTQGYAANPVCSPTRYALATGRYPTRSGLTNWLTGLRAEKFEPAPLTREMALSDTTLAEVLRDAGYHTAHVGKWHLGETEEFWPEAQGYAVNIAGNKQGHPPSYFSPYRVNRLTDGPPGEFLTDRLARETIAQIETAQREGRPFFISHNFYQVHTPLRAPEALVKKYEAKAARLGLTSTFTEEPQYHLNAKGPRRVRATQAHATYAAMVESMDTAFGAIVSRLAELGLAENTLIIFTSDNGGLSTSEGAPTSNLPFRGGKGWVYEGGIRVPFLARWPAALPSGRTLDEPVITMDIFPTVLSAAGLSAPANLTLDGRNFLSAARGTPATPRDLFWHYPHYGNQGGFPGGAIRAGEWKLVENYEDGSCALYHLARDPGELHDLAAAEPARVAELRARLHAWYRAVDAKFLAAKPGGPAAWQP